jgi:hypothetical protein
MKYTNDQSNDNLDVIGWQIMSLTTVTKPLIMALLLTQHKMISWLSEQVPKKMRSVIPKVDRRKDPMIHHSL